MTADRQNEAKWTPGNWTVDPSNPRKVVSDSIDGLDPLTGENIVGGASAGPFAIGNARLYAAASDAIEVCRALVASYDVERCVYALGELTRARGKAIAVLAKAGAGQ